MRPHANVIEVVRNARPEGAAALNAAPVLFRAPTLPARSITLNQTSHTARRRSTTSEKESRGKSIFLFRQSSLISTLLRIFRQS
jgi:hypothetical protein